MKNPFTMWTDCVKHEYAGMVATVLEGSENVAMGSRMFMSKYGEKVGSLGHKSLDDQVVQLATKKLQQMVPESKTYELNVETKTISVFVDVHVPAPNVFIFGAGHDAIPVSKFAQQCGFRVTVVDQREAFANEERFPGARIIIARSEHLTEKVQLDDRTLVVIMNHHLEKDQNCLQFALQANAPYVGLLGPRKRCNQLLNDLQAEGVVFSKETLSRLYNPIGLNIGAEGAEEIAISIVAELIAFTEEKSGESLREQYDDVRTYKMAE